MKLAIVGCGLMGSGVATLVSPDAQLLLIDREPDKARRLAETRGAAWSGDLSAAADAEVIAVVVPAAAVESAFCELAGVAGPGAIILDMATKGTIPERLKTERPDICFTEAKIVGSAVGVQAGLKALLVVDTDDPGELRALRNAFPGFAGVVAGDTKRVAQVNNWGTYYGIRAAVETEAYVRGLGLPEEWAKCASGCLAPGVAAGFSSGQMGKFAREIAEQIEEELRAEKRNN